MTTTENISMTKRTHIGTLATVLIGTMTGIAMAAGSGSGSDVNPNGYPSGEHFNLNIIGKSAGFVSPPAQYDTTTGAQIYGNVIFIPQKNVHPIQIVMESGKSGPKSSPTATTLEVTDWSSGFTPNDPARLRLPKSDLGYKVYARVLAKPTDEPSITVTPELASVEDENGNLLIELGLLTDQGFSTSSTTLSRSKGKSTAADISGLFQWSGVVYYFSNPDPTDPSITAMTVWVIDSNGDGVYEDCIIPTEEMTEIPAGYVAVTVYGKAYSDAWVFNIAAFVEYLWGMDNNGSKLLQVRFYPVQP
jgi:hypothetical protein